MKRYSVIVSKDAKLDFKSAHDYIEFTLHNPSAADNLLSEIDNEVNALKDNPFIYSLIDDPPLKAIGLRFSIVRNYLLFYSVSDQEKTIILLRFLSGRRNWMSILRQSFTIE